MNRARRIAAFVGLVWVISSISSVAITAGDILSLHDVVPVAVDWNHDGSLDLLVSTREGYVYALLTRDGLEKADFTAAHPLVYEGAGATKTITHSWEWITPRFDAADWNGDGLLDLLIADSSRTIIYYRRQRNVDGNLVLASPTTLRFSDGTPLGYPICWERSQALAIRVVDWNMDGKNDLALGESECYYLKNHGTSTTPRFIRPADWTSSNWCMESGVFEEYELFGLSGAYAVPNVVDWDNDGRLDVVCGLAWKSRMSNVPVGFIIYRRNEGTNHSPAFPDESIDPRITALLRSDPHRDFIRQGEYSVPYASDVNDDGWADLLLGGDGPLRLYMRNARKELELVWELSEIHY